MEAIASRYFAEQVSVAPELAIHYAEGVAGCTGGSERRRQIESNKTLPHAIAAIWDLLRSAPGRQSPITCLNDRRPLAPPAASVHIDDPSSGAIHDLSAAEQARRVDGEGGGWTASEHGFDVSFVADPELEALTFAAIIDTATEETLQTVAIITRRENWVACGGDGFDTSTETWTRFLDVSMVAGDGVFMMNPNGAKLSDNDYLKRGAKGRQSVRRAKPTRGTRISVDSAFCWAWCASITEKQHCTSLDIDKLVARCEGNEKPIELRRNIMRALEVFGLDYRSEHDASARLWDIRGVVDAEELYTSIDSSLYRSTALPGMHRFTMNRAHEEARLQELLAAKQRLAQAILADHVALDAAIDLRRSLLEGYGRPISMLRDWMVSGRTLHGKAWRSAVDAFEQLKFTESHLRLVVAHCADAVDDHIRAEQLMHAFENYLTIAEQLKLTYLPMARRLSARNARRQEDPEDLFQAAAIGLFRAIDLVNTRSASRFRSYSMIWMNQSVLKWRADCERLVRIPVNRQASVDSFEQAESVTRHGPHGFPDLHELTARLGWDVGSVEEFIAFARTPVTLRDGRRLGTQGSEPDQETGYTDLEVRDLIDRMLSSLKPREAKVLTLYLGLDGSEGITLEEIGSLFEVTRERVRQIRDRAFEKLRTNKVSATLHFVMRGPA